MKSENIYTISPSDLSFALDECPRCLWRKIVLKERKPRQPMPGVFNVIDSAMKATVKVPGVLADALPKGGWSVEVGAGWLSSDTMRAEGSEKQFRILGKHDLLLRKPDGTTYVVDLKCGTPKPEYVPKYGRQLHAYALCIAEPEKGEPRAVAGTGLLYWTPQSMTTTGMLVGGVTWVGVPYDLDGFKENTLAPLIEMLSGEEPTDSGGCEWCGKWRTK